MFTRYVEPVVRNEQAQDLVEYAFLIAFVGLSVLVGLQSFGIAISGRYAVATSIVATGAGARGGGNPGDPTPGAGTPGQGNPGSGNPGQGNGSGSGNPGKGNGGNGKNP
jgi:Flp pilus assembly pilin Flp